MQLLDFNFALHEITEKRSNLKPLKYKLHQIYQKCLKQNDFGSENCKAVFLIKLSSNTKYFVFIQACFSHVK